MNIPAKLRGRAAAFKLDAAHCLRQAESVDPDNRQYRQLNDRARAYHIAADELTILADSWGDDG